MSKYRKISKMMNELKKMKCISFILGIIYTLYTSFLIVSIQDLLDHVNDITTKELIIKIMIYLLFLFFYFIFSFFDQSIFRLLIVKGKNLLSIKIYEKILKSNSNKVRYEQSGVLISFINNEVVQISNYLSTGFITMLIQCFTLILNIAILITYSFNITCIIMGITLVCFFLTTFISKKIVFYNDQVLIKTSKKNQLFLNSISGLKEIKTLGKEALFIKLFQETLNEYLYKDEKANAIMYVLYVCSYLVLSFGLPLFSVLISIIYINAGVLSIGGLIAIYALISTIQEPIRIIGDTYNQKKSCDKLCERVYDKFFCETSDERIHTLNCLKKIEINIDSFCYQETKIIQNFNMSIKRGEIIVIEGESGKGKSTLFSLIMQERELLHGEILFNEKQSKEIMLKDIYENILLVNQNNVLFDGSIKFNICLDDEYSHEEIEEIINVCQLKEIIETKGIDYQIDADNTNLSGGQLQRICLARMMIKNLTSYC